MAATGLIQIRKIMPGDNARLNKIISEIVIDEFNGDPATTIAGDPALKTMFKNYQVPRSSYYVAELDGILVGGCGVKKLDGTTDNICELQRMFLEKYARGLGIGKKLMDLCLADARMFKYEKMYLETLPQMTGAISLYEKIGFKKIPLRMGNTGHTGCDVMMVLDL